MKEKIESLIGPNIILDDFRDELVLVNHFATYALLEGNRASRRLDIVVDGEPSDPGNVGKFCEKLDILLVNAKGKTGRDGTVELLLHHFHCIKLVDDVFELPAIVVATPLIQSPVFITARASLTANKKDVKIKVSSWDVNGSPAPNVVFNWMCRVPYIKVFPVD